MSAFQIFKGSAQDWGEIPAQLNMKVGDTGLLEGKWNGHVELRGATFRYPGAEDPVGARTKSIDQLLRAYRRAGLQNVQHRYYPGARHEILNETNRDEVVTDLVAWLDRHITA